MDDTEDKNNQCRPLIDILSEIPDFRKAKGKRYLFRPYWLWLAWQCYVDIRATELSQTGEATMVRNSWKLWAFLKALVRVFLLFQIYSVGST